MQRQGMLGKVAAHVFMFMLMYVCIYLSIYLTIYRSRYIHGSISQRLYSHGPCLLQTVQSSAGSLEATAQVNREVLFQSLMHHLVHSFHDPELWELYGIIIMYDGCCRIFLSSSIFSKQRTPRARVVLLNSISQEFPDDVRTLFRNRGTSF